MGPSATTLMMRRSSVPCGRSNFSSVFFMPNSSTYTLGCVEGQGVCFGVDGVRPECSPFSKTDLELGLRLVAEKHSRSTYHNSVRHSRDHSERLLRGTSM